MVIRRLSLAVLFVLLQPGLCRSESVSLDPLRVLTRLQQSIGNFPLSPKQGYRLSGNFVYKATGEDISYDATYLRLPWRWVADFRNTDPTLNMRFASGAASWAYSPEVTADVRSDQLPVSSRYDFPVLYAELIRILRESGHNAGFRIGSDGQEIYVGGRLGDGVEATFAFNTRDYFPRKVSLGKGLDLSSSWFFAISEPDGSPALMRIPGTGGGRFEIWFSDPTEGDMFRYPRRTDYIASGSVEGSFFIRDMGPAQQSDPLLTRPPVHPWEDGIAYQPGPEIRRPSLYLHEGNVAAFRSRFENHPWSDWGRTNAIVAAWAALAFWLPRLVPSPSSAATLAAVQMLLLAGIFVLIRRRRMYKQSVSWRLWFCSLLAWILVLLSGIASIQMKDVPIRGLLALHSAIRYSLTGSPVYARTARRFLTTIPRAPAPATAADLARGCEAYSLAYDLISPALPRERQSEIEQILYAYARPLYGALQGWRANTGSVTTLSAGLGLAGLATGSREYVSAARSGIEKGLQQQIEEGLHRDGPGLGADAMDNATNLIYALKRTGKENFYLHPSFLDYVRCTLQLTSPFGTLPLFGATALDQSTGSVPFLLKAADHVPEEVGRQCVAAYEAYWTSGRYSLRGWAKLFAHWIQPHSSVFANPYLMFHYERQLSPAPLPRESAVLGNGQAAVMRTGTGFDSLYLALNMRRAPLSQANRDILTFDLAAYGGLLLHGPGFPGRGRLSFSKSAQTASSNSITFDEKSQAGTQCTGIVVPLLNQPVFDHVRALADRVYEQGQVQRDIVLVRPQKDTPPYIVMVDEVYAIDPATKVQWYLHGSNDLRTGVDTTAKWFSHPFAAPSFRSTDLTLAVYSLGFAGTSQSVSGRLYYENPLFNQESKAYKLSWSGSLRFCTVMLPQRAGVPEIRVNPIPGNHSGRIGETDWISLGNLESRTRIDSIQHMSEYVVIRRRESGFPALLMVGGLEFESGPHKLVSSKPVSVSLDGLRGGLRNARPETRLEFRSPAIKAGGRYLLDGKTLIVAQDGLLSFSLGESGTHSLNPHE